MKEGVYSRIHLELTRWVRSQKNGFCLMCRSPKVGGRRGVDVPESHQENSSSFSRRLRGSQDRSFFIRACPRVEGLESVRRKVGVTSRVLLVLGPETSVPSTDQPTGLIFGRPSHRAPLWCVRVVESRDGWSSRRTPEPDRLGSWTTVNKVALSTRVTLSVSDSTPSLPTFRVHS